MKNIIKTTSVILLLFLVLVSCSFDLNSNSDKTVKITLETEQNSTKSLTSSFPQFNKDDYFWTYTAAKADSGNTVGQTTTETNVKTTGKGLGALSSSFSVGKWTFTLNAYLDQEHTKKVFTGTNSQVKLTEANESVTVKVGPLTDGKGTLAIKKMSAKTITDEDATQSVSVKKVGDNTTEYWTTTTSFSAEYINQELDCGSYIVTVTLKDSNLKTEALEPIAVTIYKNLTTTLDGDIDDYYYTVTFDLNGGTGTVLPQKVKYGEKATTPTDVLTKTNNLFDGWYKEESCTNVWDFSSDTVTADTTLHAKWILPTKGTAAVSSSAGRTNNECGWVQLWKDGPKFAEFNVGATINDYATVTEYATANVGGYYQWGGTTDKGSGTNNSNSTVDISGTGTIETDTLGDTARLLWGSNWKMPTKDQLQALINNCTWEWCDGSSKQYVTGCTLAGCKVSGKAGTDYENNCIFLPAAGFYNGGLYLVGVCGDYWSSTPNDDNFAYYIDFGSYGQHVNYNGRGGGYSVRAVLAE